MIELINRDYADFVNLSGNLVGLDIAISNLQQPLSSMHTEVIVSYYNYMCYKQYLISCIFLKGSGKSFA